MEKESGKKSNSRESTDQTTTKDNLKEKQKHNYGNQRLEGSKPKE